MKRVTDVTHIACNRLHVSIHLIVYQELSRFEAKSYNESYNSKKYYFCDLHLERRLAGFDPDPVESPADLWLPGNPAFDSELTREVGKGQTDKDRDDPLPEPSYFLATSRRCQASIVSGEKVQQASDRTFLPNFLPERASLIR